MEDKKKKKIDLILLCCFPVIASLLSLLFKVNFLIGTLLFLGIPAIYLSFRNKKAILKSSLFAFVFAIPLTLIIDYMAVVSKTWFIPNSIISFRLFGIIALEQFIWAFIWVYFIIIFYEHFSDKGKDKIVVKNFKYLWLFMISSLITFFFILSQNENLLNIKHFYLMFGIILIFLPLISFFSFFPNTVSKFVKTAVYFFALSIIYELTALKLNHWVFPSEYFIGQIIIFNFKFPLEEFIFWMVLAVLGVLSWYEFFADDKK